MIKQLLYILVLLFVILLNIKFVDVLKFVLNLTFDYKNFKNIK
jgi:hypothetical protein